MELPDLENTCRLCLHKNNNSFNIFGDENIKSKVDTIFRFEVKESAVLPKLMCIKCYEHVTNFYEYSEIVQQNQEKLKKMEFSLSKSETEALLLQLEYDLNVLPLPDDFAENLIVSEDDFSEEAKSEFDAYIPDEYRKVKRKPDEDVTKRLTKSECDARIREFVSLVCNICESQPKFDTFKQLLHHYSSQHETRGYATCCDKKIYRKDRLMNHIINHIHPEAFKCPDCGQISKSKILLNIHMKQHLPLAERPFQCNSCDQRFVLKSQLSNHEVSHFTDNQKRFICDECGKPFALKFVLIKHKLTHTRERNFVCEVCAKSFSSKANLDVHSYSHTDTPQPRVECAICLLKYKNMDTLRTHMRSIHRDDKTHPCELCGKVFQTKGALSAHNRYVHLKIKPFECNICKKQFRKKVELTEHTARHKGISLYKCPFCSTDFTSSSNYFSHRKNKHPVEFAAVMAELKNQHNNEGSKC